MDMKSILRFSLLICSFVLITGCCQGTRKKGNSIREELVSMTPCELSTFQSSLSPEEKSQYWQYKLENTLQSKNLTDDEKEVIRPLMELSDKDHYEEDYQGDDSLIIDQITEELKEKFGWDQAKLVKYLGTILTEEEIEENIRRGKNICSPSE